MSASILVRRLQFHRQGAFTGYCGDFMALSGRGYALCCDPVVFPLLGSAALSLFSEFFVLPAVT